jgi:hypothetical protein
MNLVMDEEVRHLARASGISNTKDAAHIDGEKRTATA